MPGDDQTRHRQAQQSGQNRRYPGIEAEVQITRCLPLTQHQAHPRHAALKNIRPDQIPERPVFQVLGQHGFFQADPVSGFAQAGSQFNVFDARPPKSGTEAAYFNEYLASYGAAAGPEGRGFGIAGLVHPMVKQVAVLGKEGGMPGLIIVAAEYRAQPGVVFQRAGGNGEGVRVQ